MLKKALNKKQSFILVLYENSERGRGEVKFVNWLFILYRCFHMFFEKKVWSQKFFYFYKSTDISPSLHSLVKYIFYSIGFFSAVYWTFFYSKHRNSPFSLIYFHFSRHFEHLIGFNIMKYHYASCILQSPPFHPEKSNDISNIFRY